MGVSVLPLLEQYLGTQMPRQRITIETVAKQLYAQHPDSTLAMLARGLRSGNYTAVGTSAAIASTIKARALSPILLELSTHQDWRRRRLAAHTLGEIRDTTSINRLTSLLNDSVAYVRARAAFAMGSTLSLPFSVLAAPLKDSLQVVRYSAVEGINRSRKLTISEITRYLASVSSDGHFCSNARLLLNADTTNADLRVWKAWVKNLSTARIQALRRIQRLLPSALQPALLPSKQKAKKSKRAAA
jgi:HEAT repeat protein